MKVKVGDLVVSQVFIDADVFVKRILAINKKTITTEIDPLGRIHNFRIYDKTKVDRIREISKTITELRKEADALFESLDKVEI